MLGLLAGASLLLGIKGDPLREASAGPAPVHGAAAASAYCGFDPLIPAQPNVDLFGVPMDASGKEVGDAAAYLAVGKDMAGKGRMRDAEIAFITACRIAGPLAGPDSEALADARYHLAQHYADAPKPNPGVQAEALKRAETLMSESVTAFGQTLGVTHEKTAMAAGGLARVKDAIFSAAEPVGVPRVLLAERSSPDYGVAMVNTNAMGAAPERRPAKSEPEELQAAVRAPAEAPAAAASAQQPPNVPTCLGGDCPAQAQMIKERERDRDPAPQMQASRQLTVPPARAERPRIEPARAEPVPRPPSGATGSPWDPTAP